MAADVETVLYSKLSGDVTLSNLVSTRIFPQVIPQDVALPAVVYQRISSMRIRSHDGPSELARPRFQITSVDNSYSGVRSVANAVRNALDGLQDAAADPPVHIAFIDSEVGGFSDVSDIYSIRQDFFIWHDENN